VAGICGDNAGQGIGVSYKDVFLSWNNPHNSAITGWSITINSTSGTGDKTGAIMNPAGPNDSSQDIPLMDTTKLGCNPFRASQTWQACVAPLTGHNSLGDTYTESRRGCAPPFTA